MQIIPIHVEKEIDPSDCLSDIILKSVPVIDGDIIVVAQKVISKQEGRLVDLSTVTPSLLAKGIGSQYCKDPRLVELILSESRRIIRMRNGIIIVETNQGFICANAGVDESNVQDGFATLLPVNSDLSAQKIRNDVQKQSGKRIAVIVSDTFGRPFRLGQTNHAIGVAGMSSVLDYAGTLDSFERLLRVTAIATADELSSASELVMGKSLKCPMVIIRGYPFKSIDGSVSELIRTENEDMFR